MKRIAWLVPSGVADENSPMHIPILTALAMKLGEEIDLTVFSFSSDRIARSIRMGKSTVHYLAAAWNSPIWMRTFFLGSALFREHRRRPFDLLHGFWALPCGLLAVTFSRILGIRSVCTFLGGETADISHPEYGNLRRWSSRAATLWVSRRSHSLHLLTEFQRSGLSPYHAKLAHHRVFPLGIDTTLFRPVQKRVSRPIRILHVANLTEIKDQETLLRCFSSIAGRVPARLRIVGPDYLDGALQPLAARLNIADKIEFEGFTPHSALGKHYRWAHLYVQTSLHEGQGVSVLEAMASGVVVCGTRIGILADLPASCCITTPPREPELLADAILELVRDKHRYQKTRRSALLWTHSHDIGFTVRQMISTYEGGG